MTAEDNGWREVTVMRQIMKGKDDGGVTTAGEEERRREYIDERLEIPRVRGGSEGKDDEGK